MLRLSDRAWRRNVGDLPCPPRRSRPRAVVEKLEAVRARGVAATAHDRAAVSNDANGIQGERNHPCLREKTAAARSPPSSQFLLDLLPRALRQPNRRAATA